MDRDDRLRSGRGTRVTSELIGTSAGIEFVRLRVAKAGASRAPVLITGETGTGKELVARAIHEQYGVGDFVVVDCAAVVETLFSSELFGHDAGAFTGAIKTRMGLLERANNGTAFFDEIGELPAAVQTHLLRVLATSEVRRIGSDRAVRLDFRVVAATHRDLKQEVAAGKFREDLYYRLKVMTIEVPPLRSRREDIPLLIGHFCEKHKLVVTVGSGVMRMLQDQYPWPGNVRELENCIRRMAAVSEGSIITKNDVPDTVRLCRHEWWEQDGSLRDKVGVTGGQVNTVESLRDGEVCLIKAALEKTGGDIGKAACLLRIGRTTIYRKMARYGISR